MLCVLPRDGRTNIQQRAASPSVDVFVSFEQTIETLRVRLQQSDFDLCRVSFWPVRWPLNFLSPHCGAWLAVCLSVTSVVVHCCWKKNSAVFGIFRLFEVSGQFLLQITIYLNLFRLCMKYCWPFSGHSVVSRAYLWASFPVCGHAVCRVQFVVFSMHLVW